MTLKYSHVNPGRRQGETAYVVHWMDDKGQEKTSRLLWVNGKPTYNKGAFLPRRIYDCAIADINAKNFGKKKKEKGFPWWHRHLGDAAAHQRVCETAGACEKGGETCF